MKTTNNKQNNKENTKIKKTAPKSYQNLSEEERIKVVSSMIFLTAHLDLAVEKINELEYNPVVYRHKLKHTAKQFQESAQGFLAEVLMFMDRNEEILLDSKGQPIGTSEQVQLQAWEIIDRVKKLNGIALEELTGIIEKGEKDNIRNTGNNEETTTVEENN